MSFVRLSKRVELNRPFGSGIGDIMGYEYSPINDSESTIQTKI